MDYRTLLAMASVTAGVALAAAAAIRALRQRQKSAGLWVYGALFVVAALVLWRQRAPQPPMLSAPQAVPEVLLLQEPPDRVGVEGGAPALPHKRNRVRKPIGAPPDTLPQEELLYRALSHAFDVIEVYLSHSGNPTGASDSALTRNPGGPVEIQAPLFDTRTRARKTPA